MSRARASGAPGGRGATGACRTCLIPRAASHASGESPPEPLRAARRRSDGSLGSLQGRDRTMAHSRLTLRTLGLATIALILACGHAVQAMQAKRTPAAKTSSRMTSRSTTKVALPRPGNTGRSGSSGVATVRGGKAGGSSGSVATFSGEPGASRPASRIAPDIRISTPAHPYSTQAARTRRAAPANVRRITVASGASVAPARPIAQPTSTTIAPRTDAPRLPSPAQRVADPTVAAALQTPVQRPAPKRNAFAMGLAAVALATPATTAEAPAARPRAASRTSRTRR